MISDTNSARQPTEHLSGAEVIVKALQDQGVDVVFGYPGGASMEIHQGLTLVIQVGRYFLFMTNFSKQINFDIF